MKTTSRKKELKEQRITRRKKRRKRNHDVLDDVGVEDKAKAVTDSVHW